MPFGSRRWDVFLQEEQQGGAIKPPASFYVSSLKISEVKVRKEERRLLSLLSARAGNDLILEELEVKTLSPLGRIHRSFRVEEEEVSSQQETSRTRRFSLVEKCKSVFGTTLKTDQSLPPTH